MATPSKVNLLAIISNAHIKREFFRGFLELLRLLADSDEPVSINISAAQIKFSFSGTELISELIEYKFPDYTRVIPTNYKNRFVIQREIFQRALQRVAHVKSSFKKIKSSMGSKGKLFQRVTSVNNAFKTIRCVIEADSLKINAINSDQEEAIEEIEIAYNGDAMEIGFDVTDLLDVLGNQKSENVVVELGDANSSALITVPDNPDFRYVVMPMHL